MTTGSDITYCLFWQDCLDGVECPRALDDERLAQLMELGNDLEPCVYIETPWCFDAKLLMEVPTRD